MTSIWDKSALRKWQDQGCGDEQAERLAHAVIGAAIEIHRLIGPGQPESVYENALAHELALHEIPFHRQVPIDIIYKGLRVGEGRLDFLVGGRLIVELKSCEQLHDVHRAHLRGYLCATGHVLGILINFNVAVLHEGIRRVVNSRHA